ncbi:MAG TPA: hypothetical protein ENJ19_10840 [Gammaproteobacteria bacterium]|nr:hypothetical protein [Gammaproteobacteria bacterium]
MKRTSPPLTHQQGLTLLEALSTVTIAAILLTVAVPNMQDFIASNRMSAHVNELAADLYFARAHAVNNRAQVYVCPSADGSSCAGTAQWHQGWILLAEKDGDNALSTGDKVFRKSLGFNSRFEANGSSSQPIEYFADGQTAGTNLTITVCDKNAVVETRTLTLSNEGRLRIDKTGTAGCS